MKLDTENQVKLFINLFHRHWQNGKVQDMYTKKSQDYLRSIGITIKEAKEHTIKHISSDNFYRGPSKHHVLDCVQVCEFGVNYHGEEIYVKISCSENDGACMSFHPPERAMQFPLKKRR